MAGTLADPVGVVNEIDIAAAAIAEGGAPGFAQTHARAHPGHPESVAFAVGALLAEPEVRPLVAEAFAMLPPRLRAQACNTIGPYLARCDLPWAWQLIAPELAISGAGTQVALLAAWAHLQVALPAYHAAKLPAFELLGRAACDPSATRAEIDVAVPGWLDTPFDHQVFRLASLALIDPDRAVAELVGNRGQRSVADHSEVLLLAARELVAAGRGTAFVAALPADAYCEDHAAWVQAAIESGALAAGSALAAIHDGIERVEDSASPDEFMREGRPLLGALAKLGAVDELIDLAERWQASPRLLATVLFAQASGATSQAVIDAGGFERLLARPGSEWSRDACVAVAALAGHLPWRLWPGSLADLIDLIRRASSTPPIHQ